MFMSSRACVADTAVDTPLLAVCRDDGVGLCVRALHDCASGAVVESFDGEIGPDLSQHSLQVRPGLHISGTQHIGYLSHGCDPNCRLDMVRFELVTLRAVTAGELLTIDYAATEDRLFAQFACACGAADCRRWITGRDETMNGEGLNFLAVHEGAAASV